MRRFVILFLIVMATWITPRSGGAEAFSGAFVELQAHLQPRQVALQDATDKPGKKRLKALSAAQRLMAKDSASLLKDIGNGRKVYKKLAKVYGDARFEDDTGGTGSLEDYLGDMAYTFEDVVLDRVDGLAERLGDLPSGKKASQAAKLSKKAQAALEQADEAQDAIALFLKFLGKSEKLAAKGHKAADKAEK